MKNLHLRLSHVTFAAALLLTTTLCADAMPAVKFTVKALTQYARGDCSPASINNAGEISGHSGYVGGIAWNAAGQVRALTGPTGYSGSGSCINNLGQIAGGSQNGRSAILNRDGTTKLLATVPNTTGSLAKYTNDVGQAAGYAVGSTTYGVFWDKDGTVKTVGGQATRGINNKGEVIGMTNVENQWGFVWTSAQGTKIIADGHTDPYDINDKSQVVGRWWHLSSSIETVTAFVWSESTGIRDLGTLSGRPICQATGINEQGAVVGYAENWTTDNWPIGTKPLAFYWSASTGMMSLPVLPGFTYSKALGINDKGQIIGLCFYDGGSYAEPVIWQAVPEPSSILALLTGMAGLFGIVRKTKK